MDMLERTLAQLMADRGRKFKPDMRVYHDTSVSRELDSGDVIMLADNPYLIIRNEIETGFGTDGDPKYWVKRTIDLQTGETCIVKLVFFEEFWQKLGGIDVRFFRSPDKEAEILDLVSSHPFYMHGKWTTDSANNNVRIIRFIRGPSLPQLIARIDRSYEEYVKHDLPVILGNLTACLDSLSWLHGNNLVHGDVRWDHILWDRENDRFRWIDFDYAYNFPENPTGADLFGVGKILANVIGYGPTYYHEVKNSRYFGDIVSDLTPDDFAIVETNRMMNLKKLYPFIPEGLNDILLRFSGHAEVFYESVAEITNDLRRVLMGAYGYGLNK
jgi:hypothetical protein